MIRRIKRWWNYRKALKVHDKLVAEARNDWYVVYRFDIPCILPNGALYGVIPIVAEQNMLCERRCRALRTDPDFDHERSQVWADYKVWCMKQEYRPPVMKEKELW